MMPHNFRNNLGKSYKVLLNGRLGKLFSVCIEKIILFSLFVDYNEGKMQSEMNGGTSKPIHVQRVEKAVQLNHFISEVDAQLDDNSNDSDDSMEFADNLDNLLKGKD